MIMRWYGWEIPFNVTRREAEFIALFLTIVCIWLHICIYIYCKVRSANCNSWLAASTPGWWQWMRSPRFFHSFCWTTYAELHLRQCSSCSLRIEELSRTSETSLHKTQVGQGSGRAAEGFPAMATLTAPLASPGSPLLPVTQHRQTERVAVSIYRLLLFSCFRGKLAPPSSVFLPARQRLGTAQCTVNAVY